MSRRESNLYLVSKMKKTFIAGIATGLFLLGTAGIACATPIDLNNWSQQGSPSAGVWKVAADGSSVLQTKNGGPSYFVSNDSYLDTTFNGIFSVDRVSDDDFIGFVFGWNGIADYYLFDWKQKRQTITKGTAEEGFTLSKISGSDVNFWNHTGDDIEVLDSNYSSTSGWEDLTNYAMELTYTSDFFSITIDGNEVFHEKGSFESGQFGFYNYSQRDVSFNNFTRAPSAVPEPGTLILFGTGLIGLASIKLRSEKKR